MALKEIQQFKKGPEAKEDLTGEIKNLIVPMVTPFIEVDGKIKVDTKSVANLVNFLIDNGTNAIFILGTAGEFRALNLDSKKEVITAAMDAAKAHKRRIPILVGVSADTIGESEEISKFAEKEGADAQVLCPMYREGDIQKKLDAVLEASELPVILYNNPEIHNKENLSLDFVEKAIENPRVVGIKETAKEEEYFLKLLELRKKAKREKSLKIFPGSTARALTAFEQGSDGGVIIAGHFDRGRLSEMYVLHKNGKKTEAGKIMDEISVMKKQLPGKKEIKAWLADQGIIKSGIMIEEN